MADTPDNIARKFLEPDGDWRLMEDTVFQFNVQYRRFWAARHGELKDNGPRDSVMVPALFDKATRTFNWVAVDNQRLVFDDDASAVDRRKIGIEIIKILRDSFAPEGCFDEKSEESYKQFAERYSDSKRYARSVELIKRYLKIPDLDIYNMSYDECESVWHAILIVYSSYPHPTDHNLEGIFFSLLQELGIKHPEAFSKPVFGSFTGDLNTDAPGAVDRKIDISVWKSLIGIDNGLLSPSTFNTLGQVNGKSSGFNKFRNLEKTVTEKAFLNPLLLNWPIDLKDGTPRVALGSVLGTKFERIIFIPLFDVWIGSEGYGAINGVILVFHEQAGENPTTELPWQGRLHNLLGRSEQFAREVTSTLIRRAIANPIDPPYDLVRHFLKILVEIQDWEEAVVFYDGQQQYRFKRKTPAKGKVRSWWEWTALKKAQGPKGQCGDMVEKNGKFYMWWTCGTSHPTMKGCGQAFPNLWSRYFLPDMSELERSAFDGTAIRFKFPNACRIPPASDQKSRKFMVQTYLRQQLELMRVLIPKVRARRAALRNAVSAIMGRNMSHNIGSHVLARYSTQIAIHDADTNYPDPRSDFLIYLQRRMDFLAEVGTSDQAFWAQPLSLSTQLGYLNYERRLLRFYNPIAPEPADDPEGQATTVVPKRAAETFVPLLEFISGKDGLHASVEFDKAIDSKLFSCPGGEVGSHALFVILENMIRNSARHNGMTGKPRSPDDQEPVKVHVKARASTDSGKANERFGPHLWSGLIELVLKDPQTQLNKDGTAINTKDSKDVDWQWPATLTPIWDKDGKRKPFKALPDEINYILQHEPMLAEDGGPNPQYWGLREMQICAQYLRQLHLSDLEDVPYSDHDQAAARVPLLRAERVENGDGYCLAYVLYVREARLLLTIEGGGEAGPSTFGFADGVGRLTLGKDGSAPRSDQDGLGDYAFAVFRQDDTAAEQFIAAHRAQLPVRILATPDVATDSQPTLNDLAAMFKPTDDTASQPDPLEVMETLHRLQAESGARDKRNATESEVSISGLAIHLGGLGPALALLGPQTQAVRPIQATSACNVTFPDIDGITTNEMITNTTDEIIIPLLYLEFFGKINPDGINYFHFFLDHYQSKFAAMVSAIKSGCLNAGTSIVVEPCFHGSPTTTALNSLRPGQGWELLAAGLPRILVLDERVQSRARDEHREICFQQIWQGMRVEVPEQSVCDLNSPNLERCQEIMARSTANGDNPNCDFLIVHLTVLERLQHSLKLPGREDLPATLLETINALVANSRLSETAPIMIVTGRGVPTFARSARKLEEIAGDPALRDVARRLRYLPISALLEYLVTTPSKLGLMRVLWSASQPGN